MSENSEKAINEPLHFSCQIPLCYDNIAFFFMKTKLIIMYVRLKEPFCSPQGGHHSCSVEHVYYWIEFYSWSSDKICKNIMYYGRK